RKQAVLQAIAGLSALSFSGGTTQIRRTPDHAGVNSLDRSCGRQNQESGNDAADAKFPCATSRGIPPGAPKCDSPEAPPNGVEVEIIAGNSGKLQFRIPCMSSASWCAAPTPSQLSFSLAEPSIRRQFAPAPT